MHSYDEYNKPIQTLIKLLQDDYPNGFELHINSLSAELVNNQIVQAYVSDDLMQNYSSINLSMEQILKSISN